MNRWVWYKTLYAHTLVNFVSINIKMSSSYVESARRGEVITATRFAILNGSLWAIGLAWSTAIRSIVITLIPSDTRDVVLGELLAALITTALAVGLSVLISWKCCRPEPTTVPPQAASSPVRRIRLPSSRV